VADTQSVRKLSHCLGAIGWAAAAAAAGPGAETVEGSLDPANPAMAAEATPAIVHPVVHALPAAAPAEDGNLSLGPAEALATAASPLPALAAALNAACAAAGTAAAVGAAAPVAAAAVAALAAVATTGDPSMLSAAVETIVRAQLQPYVAASHPASALCLIPADLR